MGIKIEDYEKQELDFLKERLRYNDELLTACHGNPAISSKIIVLLLEQGKSLKIRIDQLRLNLKLSGYWLK